jgi:alkanesulfonate monooxygenase SsuD/methylene tetrahydromethanopterin reductase-like flavin-dependent oxidoreductase (luciferase family)
MRIYYMTEQPYVPALKQHSGSLRVNLPNRVCDPQITGDLLHRYYDEYALCDELGLDIMLNEHHATATCLSSAVAIPAAILARETKRARLLILGYPISHRPDPLRAAEEIALIDVISRGRLELGLVKGVPYETAASNLNPVRIMDRFWESHDFLLKALSSHDEPFNWEGEFFHYRNVNVWPRVAQNPYPPIWVTTASKGNAIEIAKRGHNIATMGTGYASKSVYDAYKQTYRELSRPAPGPEKFAYLGFLAVAATEAEARARAEKMASYPRTAQTVFAPFKNPPGFLSIDDNARMLSGKAAPRTLTKDGRGIDPSTCSVQDLIDAGMMFCGTPDQVYRQITEFSDAIGGFANLLLMGQAWELNHAETVDNITLLAKEVLPRWQEYRPSAAAEELQAVARVG